MVESLKLKNSWITHFPEAPQLDHQTLRGSLPTHGAGIQVFSTSAPPPTSKGLFSPLPWPCLQDPLLFSQLRECPRAPDHLEFISNLSLTPEAALLSHPYCNDVAFASHLLPHIRAFYRVTKSLLKLCPYPPSSGGRVSPSGSWAPSSPYPSLLAPLHLIPAACR